MVPAYSISLLGIALSSSSDISCISKDARLGDDGVVGLGGDWAVVIRDKTASAVGKIGIVVEELRGVTVSVIQSTFGFLARSQSSPNTKSQVPSSWVSKKRKWSG
jgi:hypothetical protein